MRALLPPIILLGLAWIAWVALNRSWTLKTDRIHAAMPDATLDERAEASAAEGDTGKRALGGLATMLVAAVSAIWLFIVLVGMAS